MIHLIHTDAGNVYSKLADRNIGNDIGPHRFERPMPLQWPLQGPHSSFVSSSRGASRLFAASFALDDLLVKWLPSQVARVLFGFLLELMHVRDANLEALLVGPGDLERSAGRQEPMALAQGVLLQLAHYILGDLFPLMA